MFKKFLHSFARRRHPWRAMQFDELAEIYTSMSLRSFGFGIIGIFVPIYLYKNGIDLQGVFWFLSWVFLLRIPVAYVSAFVIGRIGPKHSIALSTVLFILFLSLLLTFTAVGWPLIFLALMFTVSNGLFFIAYDTDFSKVKNSEHGGKELGWLLIFEKGGSAIGPFVGGVFASVFAPELTIVFAITVLIISLIPLFLTNEPVKLHQHISFRGFKWRNHVREGLVMSSLGIDKAASLMTWPLFIAAAILTEDTYVKLGSIIAVSVGLSLFSARMFGSFIDSKKGANLLKYSAVMNAFLYMVRPFVGSVGSVLVVTTVNEPVMLGYRMPVIKGLFDVADSEKGYRIVYLAWIEMAGAAGKLLYCTAVYLLCFLYNDIAVLRWSFMPLSLVALVVLVQRFPALKKT